MRERALEHEPAIKVYEHDRARPRSDEALTMLRKISSLVKPIMRRHAWTVNTLAEFFPAESNLLGININAGQKICLRLRPAADESQFLALEDIVDTMLHELSHIVHNHHRAPFHKLWDELRDEYETLLRKGYTGEGFLGRGEKLGGRQGVIPLEEARRLARASAAAATARQVEESAARGHRLGGRQAKATKDIRSVIARAATRRVRITINDDACVCASSPDNRQRETKVVAQINGTSSQRTMAPNSSENEEAIMLAFIDLVKEDEDESLRRENESERPTKKRTASTVEPRADRLTSLRPESVSLPTRHNKMTKLDSTRPSTNRKPESNPIDLTTDTSDPPEPGWSCPTCTLINTTLHLCCHACSTERPFDSKAAPSHTSTSKSRPNNIKLKAIQSLRKLDEQARQAEQQQETTALWPCLHCGQWMEREWWACRTCGRVKYKS